MSDRQRRLDRIERLSVWIWTTPNVPAPEMRRAQRLVLRLEQEDREHRGPQ